MLEAMRIAIAGASGLIGSAVARRLVGEGHAIIRLVRSRDAAAAGDAVYWNPAERVVEAAALAGLDAVINLAGENPFALWTESKKERIRRSRVGGTRVLAEALARLPEGHRPGVLINASAVGYYGRRPPDQVVDEGGGPGKGFMAEVVRDWEEAALPAEDAGVRVVLLRFAPVLDPGSLPLGPLALATRFGLGATLSDGSQPFPWVALDEIPRVVSFVLDRPDLAGPVNVVAPERVTNAEFTDTIADVLNRPRFLRVPAPLLKVLGELGDEVLGGAFVAPRRLDEAGYRWADPSLEPALRRMLRG